MKIRLVVSLVGLAISFALPTFAQQTNKSDPQLAAQTRHLNSQAAPLLADDKIHALCEALIASEGRLDP